MRYSIWGEFARACCYAGGGRPSCLLEDVLLTEKGVVDLAETLTSTWRANDEVYDFHMPYNATLILRDLGHRRLMELIIRGLGG